MNAASNSEPSEGSISSASSPIKSNACPTALEEQQTTNNLPIASLLPTYHPVNTQRNSPQTNANCQPHLAENPPGYSPQTPLSVQLPPSPTQHASANNRPWTLSSNSTTNTLLSLQPVPETRTLNEEPKPMEKAENRLNYGLMISGYKKMTEVWFDF